MDLFSKENVKNLLKSRHTLPKKSFGQNFLIDKAALGRVLDAADIRQDDIVLEIGAGIGNLTRELAKKAKGVIAVEKDEEMCEILRKLLETEGIKNVEIVEGDIRRSDLLISRGFREVGPLNFKVVANIPYYLTAFLIRNLLESKTPPRDMTLVIQKEVAQRICSKPPDMNLLAVSVQFYAQPKIISYLKKSSFWPMPKVDSAIIKITPLTSSRLTENSLFFKIVKAGFSQPRKQLLNNLSNGLKMGKEETKSWLLKNNIQPTQRAETLSMDDWIKLSVDFFFLLTIV